MTVVWTQVCLQVCHCEERCASSCRLSCSCRRSLFALSSPQQNKTRHKRYSRHKRQMRLVIFRERNSLRTFFLPNGGSFQSVSTATRPCCAQVYAESRLTCGNIRRAQVSEADTSLTVSIREVRSSSVERLPELRGVSQHNYQVYL